MSNKLVLTQYGRKSKHKMERPSHHGKIVQEYRETYAGLSQEELAFRIGKSRRTVVTLEQTSYIDDIRLRRTLSWALQIPSELLDLPKNTSLDIPLFYPIYDSKVTFHKNLSQSVFETFTDNLRMRLNLYYLSSSLGASASLDAHIVLLEHRVHQSSTRDRQPLLHLLSNNLQVQGMIARDQLAYKKAKVCFQQAAVVAQQGNCSELTALAMGRQAVVELQQNHLEAAAQLYEVAQEIAKRAPASLRAYLAMGHAEVQGMLRDKTCLVSLDEARTLTKGIDKEDDPLFLFHSTRCSERAIDDCSAQCHALIGEVGTAITYYEKRESHLDVTMTRMQARFHIQYAEALYLNHDISCCSYLAEGFRLAAVTSSKHNIRHAQRLTAKIAKAYPQNVQVKQLLQQFVQLNETN